MNSAGDCSLRVATLLCDTGRRFVEHPVRISLRRAVVANRQEKDTARTGNGTFLPYEQGCFKGRAATEDVRRRDRVSTRGTRREYQCDCRTNSLEPCVHLLHASQPTGGQLPTRRRGGRGAGGSVPRLPRSIGTRGGLLSRSVGIYGAEGRPEPTPLMNLSRSADTACEASPIWSRR